MRVGVPNCLVTLDILGKQATLRPMTKTMDALSRQALVLPPAERLSLACALIESVEASDAPNPDLAWENEIRERIARFDSGETVGIPAADVFRKLREIAPAR